MKRISLILGLLVCVGCSSNLPDGLPRLYPCQITVIQDGAPLADAVVTLQSPEAGQLWFPMGTTDVSGVAVMDTNGRYPGAPEGVFKVLVFKGVSEPSRLGPPPPEDSPEYGAWAARASEEVRNEYIVVDPIYNDAATTPHEIKIETRGRNEMTVDVGKAVRIRMH